MENKPFLKEIFNEDVNFILEAADRGEIALVAPDMADAMGAFQEDALSLDDALESRFDHMDDGDKNNGQ